MHKLHQHVKAWDIYACKVHVCVHTCMWVTHKYMDTYAHIYISPTHIQTILNKELLYKLISISKCLHTKNIIFHLKAFTLYKAEEAHKSYFKPHINNINLFIHFKYHCTRASHGSKILVLMRLLKYMKYICISRGVTIRRATIRYVSRYVGRDTSTDTISDDTPTNLESQTHFS